MEAIYLKIIDTLEKGKKELQDKSSHHVRFIDLYDGQPDNPNEFEFVTPAVFIDYSIDWSFAGKTRMGRMTVELHVITDPAGPSDSCQKSKKAGLNKIRFFNALADLIEGTNTDHSTALILKKEMPVTTEFFAYHKLIFECEVKRTHSFSEQNAVIDNISINKTYHFDS